MRQSAAKLLNEIKTGLIYKYTSPEGKSYIGQHNTDNFLSRKRTHNYRYCDFLKAKCILELNKKFYPDKKFPNNPLGFCTALYCAFQKYSISAFTSEILKKDIPLENLNNEEDKLIIKYNTLAPNGYNLKLNNRTNGVSYSEETKKKNVRKFN